MRNRMKKQAIALAVFGCAVIAAAILLPTVAGMDASPRPAPKKAKKVLKWDELGRVISEVDERGWKVLLSHDEAGNVVEKRWIDPQYPKNEGVRRYEFDEKQRLTREIDIQGRDKLLAYPGDGSNAKVVRPDDFIEEKAQHSFMEATLTKQVTPPKPANPAVKVTQFEYDDAAQIVESTEK